MTQTGLFRRRFSFCFSPCSDTTKPKTSFNFSRSSFASFIQLIIKRLFILFYFLPYLAYLWRFAALLLVHSSALSISIFPLFCLSINTFASGTMYLSRFTFHGLAWSFNCRHLRITKHKTKHIHTNTSTTTTKKVSFVRSFAVFLFAIEKMIYHFGASVFCTAFLLGGLSHLH